MKTWFKRKPKSEPLDQLTGVAAAAEELALANGRAGIWVGGSALAVAWSVVWGAISIVGGSFFWILHVLAIAAWVWVAFRNRREIRLNARSLGNMTDVYQRSFANRARVVSGRPATPEEAAVYRRDTDAVR